MRNKMYRLLYIVFLFAALGASAQDMPERSEVRRGNRQYNKGNYEKSIERYERALEAAPESFEARYNLGNALYKAERFDKAEQTMRQAAADTLRTDDERAQAFYNLGNAQFKQQKYKEALESYKQSLRLNPSDQEAKYNYAYTKRLIDDDENGGGGGGDDKNQDKDQNPRSPTRSRKAISRESRSPFRPAFRRRSRSRCSTPFRRRRTARRTNSRRSRASWCADRKTGKKEELCISHHHIICGCCRRSCR